MGIAALAAIGLVVSLGVLSLLSGAFHFLFGRPSLEILKSEYGDSGFSFSFSWNSAREPGKFDKVKVRLFNPFGSPTQVEVAKEFDAASSDFSRDVFMGEGMVKLLSAHGIEGATVQVEVISTKDSLSHQFDLKGTKFLNDLNQARETAKGFAEKNIDAKVKPLFTSVQRTFISDPLPSSGKTIKMASNPEFAGDFSAVAGAGAATEANYSISKVWIEPGCIVCDACEAIFPEVFEVTDDSCIIRPGAPLDNGLLVEEAADACPVEVIKFTKAS
jgi:ferredoxin